MKLSKEKILRQTERFLKRTEEYQDGREIDKSLNYQIQYILSKEGNMQPEMIIAHACTAVYIKTWKFIFIHSVRKNPFIITGRWILRRTYLNL